MPIHSPHEPASGGNENSSGGALPRSPADTHSERLPSQSAPIPAQQNVATRLPVCHSCRWASHTGALRSPACPLVNVRIDPCDDSLGSGVTGTHLVSVTGPGGEDNPRCSFGCSVPLPLGSRSVDPHSTAVWCGNLLHSSPQSHTAWAVPALHPMEYSLLQPRSAPEATPVGGNPNGIRRPLCPLTLPMLCPTCHSGGGLWDKFSFTDLGTIRFRSCSLRQVSCYTFLSGFQPSWPPSCYP